MDTAPDTPGMETRDLIRIASTHGHQVNERMLETFRAQGLLPRPARAANCGRRPVWHYPPGTDRQLLALLGLRQRTRARIGL